MFRFSCKILATTITTHINNNVLNILLGHYFSTRDAGNYNQAYQWNFKCFSLVQNMVSQVAQPMLVDLRGDADRQTRAFRKLMRFTSFISFPLLLGFGLVAHEFIVLAITDKWAESARLIQMLCVSGAFMPLCTLLSNYIVSRGQSGTYFRATAALGVLSVVLMVAMSPLGIRAMVAAYVALNVAWTLVWQQLVARLSGYRLREFAADVLPFGLAAAATTALTGLITAAIAPLWLLLCTRIVVAAVLYYAVMRVARVAILSECVAFVRGKLLHR